MKLTLTRYEYRPDGIFGDLHDEDGVQLAVTLEHAYGGPMNPPMPKLPYGTYTCIHHAPNRLSYETIEITNVPGHTGILFHIGNYNQDSDGCVLLGNRVVELSHGQKMITASRQTFQKFMDRVKDVQAFTLEVK